MTPRRSFLTLACLPLLCLVLTSCGGGGSSASPPSPSGSSGTGRTGSLSRFTLLGDRLYTLNREYLTAFDIRDPAQPVKSGGAFVGDKRDLETITAHDNLLLIGASTGMYIYDTVNPDRPRECSRLLHAQARDPVVARGNFAFLTLSGARNQLDVIDISNKAAPRLLMSYPMNGPRGLGLDGDLLFVCDGSAGLRVFDASDPLHLLEVARTRELMPVDLIAADNLLVATTENGVVQYSYTSFPMKFLSRMAFRK